MQYTGESLQHYLHEDGEGFEFLPRLDRVVQSRSVVALSARASAEALELYADRWTANTRPKCADGKA